MMDLCVSGRCGQASKLHWPRQTTALDANLASQNVICIKSLSDHKEWKKPALAKMPELFSRNDQAANESRMHEQQVNELYAEIGRLTIQVNWLKEIWPPAGVEPNAWRW